MSATPTRSAPDRRHEEAVHVLRALETWGAKRGWSGADPYEGLNATRLVSPLLRHPRGRQAVTQLVKRSALDLRPLLGIRPGKSAAALAQVASAYARNGFLPDDQAKAKLERALSDLEALSCDGFEEACWGYHFDVQTRVFFYPKGAPNTIATSFAGMAMLDAYEVTGKRRHLELAQRTGEFFRRHVPQTQGDSGAFFGYLVGDRTPIHNANMLACAFLARLGRHADGHFDESARAGVEYTVAHQRSDGSWPYGELAHLGWVDGFHTGYVLDCLETCVRTGMEEVALAALERGLDYYQRELFLPDGTPKYLASSLYPIDIQCAAQGIQTFARTARRHPKLAGMAWRVFDHAVSKMRREDGAFIFQRRRLWRNSTPHVRWSAAPMMLALTHLVDHLEWDGSDH